MYASILLDEYFPTNQFSIDGFSASFSLDRNNEGWGFIIYIRKVIPCKKLNHILPIY